LQIGAKGALGKIAYGCGKIPLFEHDKDFSIWKANFIIVKFNLWKEINKLWTYYIDVQETC
jgi:hypothetical protein